MKVVMVVEDDDETRDALATVLEDHYQVLCAENGAAALALLQSDPGACDIILLDLMMPVMNGWDFRRKQKELAQIRNIPVLLMSAGGHIASSCVDLGASDWVAKPVELGELLNKLQRYCS